MYTYSRYAGIYWDRRVPPRAHIQTVLLVPLKAEKASCACRGTNFPWVGRMIQTKVHGPAYIHAKTFSRQHFARGGGNRSRHVFIKSYSRYEEWKKWMYVCFQSSRNYHLSKTLDDALLQSVCIMYIVYCILCESDIFRYYYSALMSNSYFFYFTNSFYSYAAI